LSFAGPGRRIQVQVVRKNFWLYYSRC
jgi:hypothetical protein